MPRVPGGVPERPKGTGCKPVGSAYGGSNPPAPTVSMGENARFSPCAPSPFRGKGAADRSLRKSPPGASAAGAPGEAGTRAEPGL
jgi:hypothetical protein